MRVTSDAGKSSCTRRINSGRLSGKVVGPIRALAKRLLRLTQGHGESGELPRREFNVSEPESRIPLASACNSIWRERKPLRATPRYIRTRRKRRERPTPNCAVQTTMPIRQSSGSSAQSSRVASHRSRRRPRGRTMR